jgi:transcriptional regulator with PAS, ATPase and Fis domain
MSVIDLADGERELGRDTVELSSDRRISRRHARVRCEGSGFSVRDLGSQNGTHVDGKRSASVSVSAPARILRLGDSLLLLSNDIRPYQTFGMSQREGFVSGPELTKVWSAIADIARTSQTLHVHGESGTGKESAVQAFMAGGPRPNGPLVAVNCAAIPEGVAERLLFGAVRGAYSGATADSQGYVQAAHGGVLFLDEIGELDLTVQAKLLRVLESREVLPLGASRARPVQVMMCSATHRDLRALVASGRLREDLYFRISMPAVHLPPLRERPADIPFLIAQQMSSCAPGLRLHPSLIESCLLRPWPGNIRELLAEIRTAAQRAQAAGHDRMDSCHLTPTAGMQMSVPAEVPAPLSAAAEPAALFSDPTDRIRVAAITEALRHSDGNVSTTARALGMQRTQLRRWLTRYGINPRQPA